MIGNILRWLFQRSPKTPSRAGGMTRELMITEIEHMIGVITCASPFFFDIRGPGTDPNILVREWAFRAQDQWLESFIGLVVRPPEAEKRDDYWDDAVSQMLAAWARRKPELVLPQIGPLLLDSTTRAVVLKAFALAIVEYPTWREDFPQFADQCARWLHSVFQEHSRSALTEDEAYDLQDIEYCVNRRNVERKQRQV